MSYSQGEAAILTRLQAHEDFSSDNATRGDYGLLNSGHDNVYLVVRPGDPGEQEYITFRVYVVAWNTVIEVWQRYLNETTTLTDLEANVEKIKTQMESYPQLGLSQVQYSIMTIGTPTEQWTEDGSALVWLKQEINIQWQEQSESQAFA